MSEFKAGTWYPIEIAPTDGQRVIVFVNDGMSKTEAFAKLWAYGDGTFRGVEGFSGGWRITHWTPIPESPQ